MLDCDSGGMCLADGCSILEHMTKHLQCQVPSYILVHAHVILLKQDNVLEAEQKESWGKERTERIKKQNTKLREITEARKVCNEMPIMSPVLFGDQPTPCGCIVCHFAAFLFSPRVQYTD